MLSLSWYSVLHSGTSKERAVLLVDATEEAVNPVVGLISYSYCLKL